MIRAFKVLFFRTFEQIPGLVLFFRWLDWYPVISFSILCLWVHNGYYIQGNISRSMNENAFIWSRTPTWYFNMVTSDARKKWQCECCLTSKWIFWPCNTRCCVVAVRAGSSHRAVTSPVRLDKNVWSIATSPASPPLVISGGFVQWLDLHLHM